MVDDDGVPTAVYTGVDRRHTGLGTICLARAVVPDDETLTDWKPLPAPVVGGPPPGLDVVMFRDPFVFRAEGRRQALVGAAHADGTPSVLLYDCEDLLDWRFTGVFLDGRDPVAAEVLGDKATGWECPALFETPGGDWVLVLSLWDGSPLRTAYLTGRVESGRFVPRGGGRLDHGRDLYAATALQEPGRALLWGWSWEAREQEEADRAGWAGVLTAPRVMDVGPDGTLRVAPAPELELLRAAEPFATNPGVRVPLPGAYDLTVTARSRTTVSLARSASGAELTVALDPEAGSVTLDRDGWPRTGGQGPVTLGPARADGGAVTVRLLVDGSLFELFVDDRVSVTERIYWRADDVPELLVTGEDAEVTGWEQVPPTSG
ncbi:beta-fructofuranosidase OS=Streptomyces griseorubiginosus OX=67304 GN=AQJ54_28750 PE=3 SV=1 [Streptomyces griseorubiginosus]